MKPPGGLSRGRRRPNEVPPIPAGASLSDLQASAQSSLRRLVEASGGRIGSRSAIQIGQIEVLTDLFDDWARRHGSAQGSRIHFSGRPGLWRALDELYPLEDPTRWRNLRNAVLTELEARNWIRRRPPSGQTFDILLDEPAEEDETR